MGTVTHVYTVSDIYARNYAQVAARHADKQLRINMVILATMILEAILWARFVCFTHYPLFCHWFSPSTLKKCSAGPVVLAPTHHILKL